MRDRGTTMTIRLQMGATTLPDATSYNTIAEIRGTDFPDEIVLISGHIDSCQYTRNPHHTSIRKDASETDCFQGMSGRELWTTLVQRL